MLDELGSERLEYVRLKQLAVTMYKINNNLFPSYMRRIFTNTSNVHSHNLRNYELNYYDVREANNQQTIIFHFLKLLCPQTQNCVCKLREPTLQMICSVEQDSLRD